MPVKKTPHRREPMFVSIVADCTGRIARFKQQMIWKSLSHMLGRDWHLLEQVVDDVVLDDCDVFLLGLRVHSPIGWLDVESNNLGTHGDGAVDVRGGDGTQACLDWLH